MTRISPRVTDIKDAAKLVAGKSSESLNILMKLIEEKLPATAWTVLYKLDENEVYDDAIAQLYGDSSNEIERFIATVKSRQFLRRKQNGG